MPRAPLIVDVRRNALDDGPGIRSTVFFKGCVLRCSWCQNPETLSPRHELQLQQARCIACGQCAEVCPEHAVHFELGQRQHAPERCVLCGRCVEQCPAGGLRQVGRLMRVSELVRVLLEDEPFYRHSGGGVTLSGGEPTMHLDFVVQLCTALRAHGIHLLLETCGQYVTESFESRLLPLLDLVYFDLKLADPALHREHTGAENVWILKNFRRLIELAPARVLPRIPLIPDITDTESNLQALAELILAAGGRQVALLPYNPLWATKYSELGRTPRPMTTTRQADGHLAHCRAVVARAGLRLG